MILSDSDCVEAWAINEDKGGIKSEAASHVVPCPMCVDKLSALARFAASSLERGKTTSRL